MTGAGSGIGQAVAQLFARSGATVWVVVCDAVAGERGLALRAFRAMVKAMNELIFEVSQEVDGGFVAEALGESIFTQADSWDELRAQVREAVTAFYFDRPAPARVRLHLVRDEVLA